ncbi:transglutaminase-like domain-containing protein [Caenimonas aquaedulcis]|uniref:Transglutaminase family protein n=1 Tax=Caenimonas aquaedulcis TaxID=2793270 RepID=A0A931H7M5_9BURK|nr:transglutaminase family protein [Caenimonas aquaedulcis]MBG9390179.1 transglutaminase family protein [Caenimonas aquaedulcis]
MTFDKAPLRLRFSISLAYDVQPGGADFIFNIHAAQTAAQRVVHEQLNVNPFTQQQLFTDPATYSRYLRLQAQPGPLSIDYSADVDIAHLEATPGSIDQVSIASLPGSLLPYIYPSRYCESDRLLAFANAQFGHMTPGYYRAMAVRDWVASHVAFTSNSTSGTTSACDTLLEKRGVCRDFAHLMIALCRALNMPARFATGIDYGADPALGPQDFHAYVEVYLGGSWWLFDPSGTAIPMGFVRLGTGRDAADCAFAMIFGAASMSNMTISIAPVAGAGGTMREPVHTQDALSTDSGLPGLQAPQRAFAA